MQRKSFKKLMVGGALLASLGLVAGCGEEGKKINEINPEEVADIFESAEYSVDEKNLEITLPEAVDSLVVGSLSTLGGAKYFVATDDDPVDPSFDWDEELVPGSVIKFADTNSVRIVVLDDENRTIAVWTISYPVEEKSSSSVDADVSSSSKYEDEESSSSEETVESSSSETVDESSSSVEPVEESSSSEIIPSSSSEETVESSSSEEIVESSSSEEVVESSSSEEVVVSSSSEEVVVESSSSEIVVPSSSSEVVESSSSEVVPESSSSEEIVVSSSSEQVEPESSSSEYVGAQLPGSHFDSWDKTFWGSTSDAMAKARTAAAIKIEAPANAVFEKSMVTLTSSNVVGSFIGIEGSWKLAGGFYFAGSYSGTTALNIYQQGYTSGTPDASYASDLSKDMTFGRPFSARPVSFDVTYSYKHVANSNSTYPQQGLIYVILVSANNEIVAAGSIVKTASSEFATERVDLQYGSDAGLLGKGYAGINDLELGTGEEEVASIRVMFASSAYAFVVDGGALGNSGKYRGGEGSQLTIDEFKLNY